MIRKNARQQLEDLVSSISNKHQDRQQKVERKQEEIKQECEQLKEQVQEKQRAIIHAEVNGVEDTGSLEKELRKLKDQLYARQEKLEMYKTDIDLSLSAVDQESLRKAALKAKEETDKELIEKYKKLNKLNDQIDNLMRERDQLNDVIRMRPRDEDINALKRIKHLLHPQASTLDFFDEDKFLKEFIEGKSPDEFFMDIEKQQREEAARNQRFLNNGFYGS